MQTNHQLLFLAGSPTLPAAAKGGTASADWAAALGHDVDKGLEQIRGDFAVAWRDGVGRTLLAVDRFAVRTLCWCLDGDELRFAERADELAGAKPEIDPQAIFEYLFFHAIPSPRTVFKGVHRLPPGHVLLHQNGRVEVRPYWTPAFEEDPEPGIEQRRETFRRLVESAVARRLDGGVPACYLSGGTDSSTVAGMVGRAAGQPAHTYSIGFEAQGYDEMAYARIAARHFGTRHHEYYVTPDDVVAGVPQVAGYYDQPFGNSSALPAYYCALRACEDGVTRLLAGDGGDELFGGNSRYAKQRVFGWYGRMPAPVRCGLMEPLLQRSPLGRLPLLRKGASYIEQARVPMPDRLQMYNLLLRLGVDDVLTPPLLEQVDVDAPLRQQRQVWAAPSAASDINRTLAYDWRYTLAESDLPKVNMTARLAGVGVAFPFLDDDLLAFSLRLPASYKLRGLKLRWFFKEALRGFLPDEILTKKKQGFGLPFGVWATRHDALRALATDSVRALAARGVVREHFVRSLLGQRLAEHPGYYGEMVWILMMLEQWLRRHAPYWRLAD
jgi:asparagine synthase (glutamine-hydrolysing)